MCFQYIHIDSVASRLSWDRLVLPYWWCVIAIVILVINSKPPAEHKSDRYHCLITGSVCKMFVSLLQPGKGLFEDQILTKAGESRLYISKNIWVNKTLNSSMWPRQITVLLGWLVSWRLLKFHLISTRPQKLERACYERDPDSWWSRWTGKPSTQRRYSKVPSNVGHTAFTGLKDLFFKLDKPNRPQKEIIFKAELARTFVQHYLKMSRWHLTEEFNKVLLWMDVQGSFTHLVYAPGWPLNVLSREKDNKHLTTIWRIHILSLMDCMQMKFICSGKSLVPIFDLLENWISMLDLVLIGQVTRTKTVQGPESSHWTEAVHSEGKPSLSSMKATVEAVDQEEEQTVLPS